MKNRFVLILMFLPVISGFSLNRSSIDTEYQSSRKVLARIDRMSVTVSWKELYGKVRLLKKQVSASDYKRTIAWLDLMKNHVDKVASLYGIHGKVWSEISNVNRVQFGEAYVRPDEMAFLRYAVDDWKRMYPTKPIPRITSGYRSPAYQCVVLAQFPGSLRDVLRKAVLPGMSRHQRDLPDVSLSLGRLSKPDERRFFLILTKWGFYSSYPKDISRKGEVHFIGVERVYSRFFKSKRGLRIYKQLLPALYAASFFPHPDYLKAMIALSLQESDFVWNPRLSNIKKKRIGEQFSFMFGKGETALSLAFRLMIPRKRKVKLEQLKYDFSRMLSLKNRRVTEYDLQVWMSDFRILLTDWIYQNHPLMCVADVFGNVTEITNRVAHEPQTFGLWQLNVNHFIEKMGENKDLPRRFRSIYYLEDGKFKVNRDEWIACLCGTRDAALERSQTLELIFEVVFKERFENHYNGNTSGVRYFVVENLTGEMSTYRAALQVRLNKILGSELQADGDLAIYGRYGLTPKNGVSSRTMKALAKYIRKYLPSQKVKSEKFILDLISAGNWKELSENFLYRKIMGDEAGTRIFPQVRSSLYGQSGKDYAKRVLRMMRNL